MNPAEIKVDLGTKHTAFCRMTRSRLRAGVVARRRISCRRSDRGGVYEVQRLRGHRPPVQEAAGHQQAPRRGFRRRSRAAKRSTAPSRRSPAAAWSCRSRPRPCSCPPRQCGLPKDADLSELKNKKVPLKILEYNEQRRRAVGSIRNALRAQHKQGGRGVLRHAGARPEVQGAPSAR